MKIDKKTVFWLISDMYHDTHIHLEILLEKLGIVSDFNSLDIANLDTKSVLQIEQKISELLTNHEFALQSTVDLQNFVSTRLLFQKISKIRLFFGSHPEIVQADFDLTNYLDKQKLYLQNNVIDFIGLGEIGLDYHYTQDKNLIKIQHQLFQSQIQLAMDLNLPIMIHCREAFEDLFAILRDFPAIHNRFLIHCFTGNVEQLRTILDFGGKVGYGGIITFGKSADYLRETVVYCPEDSFVLETDLPFLSPVPFRGQLCLPEYIQYVCQKVVEIKHKTEQEIWQLSKENCVGLFKFS